MTEKKRYEVKGSCPQCACGSIYHMTAGEIEAKTIGKENIELTCPDSPATPEIFSFRLALLKLDFWDSIRLKKLLRWAQGLLNTPCRYCRRFFYKFFLTIGGRFIFQVL